MRAPRGVSNPYASLRSARATFRFYHGDALEIFGALPAQSVGVIVTSPPYNVGVRYRSYDDALPRRRYLEWTDAWIRGAARVLVPDGSLFLNVGSTPTRPWTALDVAQAARPHLHLQNLIHWIKSIAIDRESAGARSGLARDLAVGHYKPINSAPLPERLPRVRFSLHAGRANSVGSARDWGALPGSVEHRAMAGRGRRHALPWQYVVYPV